jgi:glycosyltransferase involved in cell wall biosynthesis
MHAILEDDEVRLLKSLGHNVCCLGINGKITQAQDFRLPIKWNDDENAFFDAFDILGGKFCVGGNIDDFIIPADFIRIFDCVVVMHDIIFIKKFWDVLSERPVFWRTIGQGMQDFELIARPLRAAGLFIIRYSPTEKLIPDYLGEDAIIRFCKSPNCHSNWTGADGYILTFSNLYYQRYPEDYCDYINIIDGMPARLGGYGNDQFSRSIGLLTPNDQLEAYRGARAYLYASGLGIPYTLNFIEAWMVGIPTVVYAPNERVGPYFEIDKIIEHGIDGYVCRTIQDTRQTLNRLLNDTAMAQRIGSSGRARAIELFSAEGAAQLWQKALSDGVRNAKNSVES